MPLPDALREIPQWLVSGEDKAPRSVKTGHYTDVRDRSQYTTYEQAKQYAEAYGYDVGFALTPYDPFAVIDLDPTENPEVVERHQKILDAFESYAELSRSGKGVHIWVRGSVPRGVRRDNVEVYSEARYMICTGRNINQYDVNDRQQLLNILFEEISQGDINLTELVEVEETLTDNEVLERAWNASNHEKFRRLWMGDWNGFPSQSEADFALMDMLCFYSKSNEQCRRLFRSSGLGKRKKAQRDKYLDYMISKFRAEEPPEVDFSTLLAAGPELLARETTHGVEPVASSFPKPALVVPRPSENGAVNFDSIPYPPGFLGEIAHYFYTSSYRPVREVSIAAAIAMTAGIFGRQFNISGTGLNQYIFLLAKTGVGKDDAAKAIERLLMPVRERVPSISQFVGPGQYSSGQAIIKALDEKPCLFSVLGEIGHTLQDLADQRAQSYMRTYRRVLLDLYGKSGHGNVVYSSAYSDREKNTKSLMSPALTIFGDSTPDVFYSSLSSQHVADGLIPRFLTIEYFGDRPDPNNSAFLAPPDDLVQRFRNTAETVLLMAANNSVANVMLDVRADAVQQEFNEKCDYHIRHGADDANRQLWNRGHLKLLRLAGLQAVLDNPSNPIVTEAHANWALLIVERDLRSISTRFDIGDIGEGASKQRVDMERVLHEYLQRDVKDLEKYGVTDVMHSNRAVPFAYIQRRLANLASFKNDRRGSRGAIRETIQELVDSNVIIEVPRQQALEKFGSHGKVYVVR